MIYTTRLKIITGEIAMIIKPKTKGFICTTAHPGGCAENLKKSAELMNDIKGEGPKSVLVIGSSTGYGLASRIAAAFGYGAATLGVAFERAAKGKRTASAGWYNTLAFDELANNKRLVHKSLNGDAFSDEMKEETIRNIKNMMPGGKVDMVIYSLASPKRTDPHTGITWNSTIKSVGQPFRSKTVNLNDDTVTEVTVDPAAAEEIESTVKVMGGEDWLMWMDALKKANVLDKNVITLAYSYIGPEITNPMYKDGTIGIAKQDLYKTAPKITKLLNDIDGHAFVSVNKAVVTQASSAIPVVPLYISILFKIMKEKGLHEDCDQQMKRMFERIYDRSDIANRESFPTDDNGLIRMDDWEMQPDVQSDVLDLWDKIDSHNIFQISDIEGYKTSFLRLFGFEVPGIDYEEDVQP